nr:unnamed protein product [Spirometra erinaceieuropaei]
MLSATLMDAYYDEPPGIRIDYGADGRLLNSRRMKTPTCLCTTTIHDLLWADNYALNSTTEEYLQRNMYLFSSRRAHFVLTFNKERSVVMHQRPSNADPSIPRIRVDGAELKTVDNFNYLDSLMPCCIRIGNEVASAISKTTALTVETRLCKLAIEGFPSDPTAEMSAGLCAKCAKGFVSGSILNALDKRWHPECFLCAGCQNQLANQSFHCKDEVPYCVNCWKQKFQPRCATCQVIIDPSEQYMTYNDNAYHKGVHTSLEFYKDRL